MLSLVLDVKIDDLSDATTDHFDDDGKCHHCGSDEDSATEKKRFLHILKYCNRFSAFGTATKVYKMDSSKLH